MTDAKYICIANCPEFDYLNEPHCKSNKTCDEYFEEYGCCRVGNIPAWKEIGSDINGGAGMTDRETIAKLEYLISGESNQMPPDYINEIEFAISALRERMEREDRDKKISTNTDHIRAMTEEELEKFIVDIYGYGFQDGKAGYGAEVIFDYDLAWLKQPYKEERL